MADVVGTYALTSIDGQSLPAPFGQSSTIIYDTLTFVRDSTYTSHEGGGALCSPVVTDSGRYTGVWTLDAATGRVLTTNFGKHNVPITAPFTVIDRGASLTFDAVVYPGNPGGGLWVFERVR